MSLLTSGRDYIYRKQLRTTDPERDWLMIVFCSILAFIVIVVWNAWAFDRIASGNSLGVLPQAQPETAQEFSVEEIKTIFNARAEEMRKYQEGVYSFTDPSK